MKKTICLDFDGVIHKYSKGYLDGTIYDSDVYGSVPAIRKLLKEYNIVICSARASSEKSIAEIKHWLKQIGFTDKEIVKMNVTNVKPIAIAYIDDRAIRFINWTDTLNYLL
jgi:hypothetical protein